jgi:hypothetical protein
MEIFFAGIPNDGYMSIWTPSAGVLGSYLATQAAARAGIGRFGPGNPRPVTAAGGIALHITFYRGDDTDCANENATVMWKFRWC